MKNRKNETQTDISLFNYLSNEKTFSGKWNVKKVSNQYIQDVLDCSSKGQNSNRGEPDLIYINETKKLLILIENKFSTNDHASQSGNASPKKYAVDGIKHYLSLFCASELVKFKQTTQNYLNGWNFVGIAFSGDISDRYNHIIDTFVIEHDSVKNIQVQEFMEEDDYLSFFENIDIEALSKNISRSSREINRLLRAIDSQKRPVLLSALMICLYEKPNYQNDFKSNYSNWETRTIIRNIPTTIHDVLEREEISADKIGILENEIAFIKTDNDINNTEILKSILRELEDNVIPLFNKKSNFDILGKFYEEFLRYAGVANVKKGIVLTPNHITKLFTDLIDIKLNDVILDTCCGTGAFLIAGMNKLIDEIESSSLSNKKDAISNIKTRQLIGFEKSTTMYALAISNMLFRGDGKSRVFNLDSFSTDAKVALEDLAQKGIYPSVGFINPPYGGKDNQTNPTKKEIQFLESILDSVSRFVIIIAPLSTFFKDSPIRKRILSKHTLKYVINMPSELFQPNASTHTAIAVFETHSPHGKKEVVFYDLKDDGFILSKNRGRTDVLNKWAAIMKSALITIKNAHILSNGLNTLVKSIHSNDEWIIQAHSQTDYSTLSEISFISSIKYHVSFYLKLKLKLLNEDIDDISMMEILSENISKNSVSNADGVSIDCSKWKLFLFSDIFTFERGKRLVTNEQIGGEIAYISSSKENNGIDNYITPPDFMTVHENAMTINNSGSVGYVFYHEYQFVSSDHCTVFRIKERELTPFLAIFIKPIVEAIRDKYNFAREISDERLEKETIILPCDEIGSPDWDFIERFIKTLPYSSNVQS